MDVSRTTPTVPRHSRNALAAPAPRPTRTAESPPAAVLAQRFLAVRSATLALCAPLSPEDCAAQSMPDASPVKWHLAHGTWFFEHFALAAHARRHAPFDPAFDYLWNSYYEAVGPRHARPSRGLLTRPSLARVLEYRAHVDAQVLDLLDAPVVPDALAATLALGLAHEEQHQELIVTDVKHLLAANPLQPAYHARTPAAGAPAVPLRLVPRGGGLVAIGAEDHDEFCFDAEQPLHRAWLEPHALANRCVTNGEYREFVRDGGYRRAELWMSDGWATVQAGGWQRPLYWGDDLESEYTLAGRVALDAARPVVHVSWYEADAYARWAGTRLPTEAEWESAAPLDPAAGHWADSGELHPRAAGGRADAVLRQFYGDVWEWTASAYAPYPGFRASAGAVGEYNGKFMCNQYVLRGGSCATPPGHVRATYRNFFPPHARWQYAGIRLAKDVDG